MKILLSWSGARSQAVASALRGWLPRVIQALKPWMSSADIDRGSRWQDEIGRQLEECSIGILCVTSDNLAAPWLLFEAGALSKIRANAHVCTFLHQGISPTDLSGPLALFQASRADKVDTLALLRTINSKLPEPISTTDLEDTFEIRWPSLENELAKIPPPDASGLPHRNDRELLEEILTTMRDLARKGQPSSAQKALSTSEALRNIRRHAKTALDLMQSSEDAADFSDIDLMAGSIAYVRKNAPHSSMIIPKTEVIEIITGLLEERRLSKKHNLQL